MLRRTVMIVLVLAVSGLVPLMATRGSCTDMPCCHHHAAVVTSAADCCSPATCIKEDQAIHSPVGFAERHVAVRAVAVVPVTVAHQRTFVPHPSSSPPISTTERLSVLSILLI